MSDLFNQRLPDCPACTGTMLQIGNLPKLQQRRRILVFRCERCDYVLTHEECNERLSRDAES